MERKTDILIIGGGIMGLTIAYYAAKQGLGKVAILERQNVGRGASSRNSGAVREQYANEPMIRLAHMSIEQWEELPAELGWNILFDQKGYLIMAREEAMYKSLKAAQDLQHRFGVPSKMLGPDAVREIVPFINAPDLLGASFNPRDGSIHHDAVLWAFEKAGRKMGVQILEHTEATGIIEGSGKVKGATTDAGEFGADAVVNVTGLSAVGFFRRLGIELPIRALKREALVTEPYKRVVRPVVTDRTTGLLLNQTLRGEIVIDSNQEGWEGWSDMEPSYWFAHKVATEVCTLYPPLRYVRILRQWTGEYDLTPDRGPVMFESDSVENLYGAAGFSGHGFMMAPAVGMLFAEALSARKAPELMQMFSPERFQTSS